MTLRLLTAILVYCLCGAAAADIIILEDAYEVRSDRVLLPDGAAGNVIVRTCESCAPVTLRMSAQSRYEHRRQDISLEEFKAGFEQRLAGGDFFITVFVEPETRYVTRIVMP